MHQQQWPKCRKITILNPAFAIRYCKYCVLHTRLIESGAKHTRTPKNYPNDFIGSEHARCCYCHVERTAISFLKLNANKLWITCSYERRAHICLASRVFFFRIKIPKICIQKRKTIIQLLLMRNCLLLMPLCAVCVSLSRFWFCHLISLILLWVRHFCRAYDGVDCIDCPLKSSVS